MGNKLEQILIEVSEERQKQNEKWGEQNHNAVEWTAILTEEVGEVAKEAVDFHFINKIGIAPAAKKDQEKRLDNYRNECIQVAAVAVQMVEALDRARMALYCECERSVPVIGSTVNEVCAICRRIRK